VTIEQDFETVMVAIGELTTYGPQRNTVPTQEPAFAALARIRAENKRLRKALTRSDGSGQGADGVR
jgi:hypothetical protein